MSLVRCRSTSVSFSSSSAISVLMRAYSIVECRMCARWQALTASASMSWASSLPKYSRSFSGQSASSSRLVTMLAASLSAHKRDSYF